MSGKKKRVTIYDIAKASGTSASTVSLVLNGSWEKYRINADTADKVSQTARSLGYRANLRARGLRTNRTGLIGMVIPHHRNRFFAGLVEHYEAEAHKRGLCPIVVSTQRNRETEESVVRTLLAQQVESLILVGPENPDGIDALCEEAGTRHVNLDLPGRNAFSVVTDNRGGARELGRHLLKLAPSGAEFHFIGGRQGEYATDLRIAGFADALNAAGIAVRDDMIDCCGYHPEHAQAVLSRLAARSGRLPAGLFINSITAMEGFSSFLALNPEAAQDCVVACFDWDPFAACLPLPVVMMRQNVAALTAACFDYLDAKTGQKGGEVMIAPELAVTPANRRMLAAGKEGSP
ncbi:MAG: substrate-binding domain-containing protein [Tropicimonas sp.]|uniref:LacI family DNA-binding transcriptional regulator n=1 Tax=Tropicimonas sp. TaxID=2067044 RepID=UPI003A84572E